MKDQLTRAEGFFELGMHEEAWAETGALPPIDRIDPLVLELRLRICTALAQWELGEGIADVLPFSAVEAPHCRETVARFHHAHARVLSEKSEYKPAREAMRAASEAWPDIRIELVNDPVLENALNGADFSE